MVRPNAEADPVWDPCQQSKVVAASRFRAGNGFLYVQHPHKAGGSSLCAILSAPRSGVHFGLNINCNPIFSPHDKGINQSSPAKEKAGREWRGLPDDLTLNALSQMLIKTGRNAIMNEDRPFPVGAFGQPPFTTSWSFIAILRDPVARILSHFAFDAAPTWRNVTAFARHSPYFTRDFFVRTYAPLPPAPRERVLAWDPFPNWNTASEREIERSGHSPVPGQYLMRYDAAPPTHSDLERAKRTLSGFTVVLVLEFMNECAPLLTRWFGVPIHDLKPRMDIGGAGGRQGRPHEEKLLRRLNQLDLQLYDFAIAHCRRNAEATYFRKPRSGPYGLCARSSS
jgi:hypothetical protein